MSLLNPRKIIIGSAIVMSLFLFPLLAVLYVLDTTDIIPLCHTTNRPYQLLTPGTDTTQFAIIGDYGDGGDNHWHVTEMLYSWHPDFIVTVGDNNYGDNNTATIDANIGQFYGDYISHDTEVNSENRFFPALGNHDWLNNTIQPYLDYFALPGNERYYDFVRGPIHFFMLDSDPSEPDGITEDSVQAQWLQAGLAASTTPFQFVILHHPPYSSGNHGSTKNLQWSFAEWGADAVFAGHDHDYERLEFDGIPYFVNGLGGHSITEFHDILPISRAQYNCDYGAMRVIATDTSVTLQFVTVEDDVIDSYTLIKHQPISNELSATANP